MKEYKYHYTYLIENLTPTDDLRFYIGVKSCDCPPEENVEYMGSSKFLDEVITTTGKENFQKTILAEFNSRYEAEVHENAMHEEHQAATNPQFYNKKNGVIGFHVTDESIQNLKETVNNPIWKATTGKLRNCKISKTKNDPNWKATRGNAIKRKFKETVNNPLWKDTVGVASRQKFKDTVYTPAWKAGIGKESIRKLKETVSDPAYKETAGKAAREKRNVTINDPIWKATRGKEQSGNIKKTLTDPNWKDTVGREQRRKQKETIDDPNWKDTVGKRAINQRIATITDADWIKANTFICPHCNKSMTGKGMFNRWHRDNCKQKPITHK